MDDNVVEFMVDTSDATTDLIYYFPAGVTEDQNVLGVWDYNLKYGSCPSNSEQNEGIKSLVFNQIKKSVAKS